MVVIVIVLVAIAVMQRVQTSVYAITPGDATPVAPLVRIEGLATDAHPDRIMLTDVYLTQLTAWQWIVDHFESHVQFISSSQLLEPGIPASEYEAQGFLEMSDSKQAAEVAALRALGWMVPSVPTGAVVTAVNDPSPAYAAGLRVADEVVALDGTPVDSSCSLIGLVHGYRPGTVERMSVRRARINAKGVITWATPSTITATTTAPPAGLVASGCPGVVGADDSWLGIALEDGVRYDLPGTISINTTDIGGPSAGLAMTLTLINKLSAGSLTGHRVVAATGTIAPNGDVGDVGGVAEKTVAVQRAGAKVFIVPQVEVATAEGAARPGLRVIGVTSLAQALRDLRHLGGATPKPLTKPH